jgi:arginine dihydrolase
VASEVVEASGHLIDSGLLNGIFDTVIRHNASFEVMRFTIGRTNDEPSLLRMRVTADSDDALRTVVENLVPLGCLIVTKDDVTTKVAEADGWAPDDFYSTTNHETHVRKGGKWRLVADQRMDAVIVIEGSKAACRKLRDIKKGDAVVCGVEGIRVVPTFQDRDRHGFAFMTNEVSSERRVEAAVTRVAEMMRSVKAEGKKIAVAELIKRGFVHVLLAGNALAVHDVELQMFGTSLGVNLETGRAVEGGHHHHMRAINAVRRAGNIREAVDQGIVKAGIFYECEKAGVDYVLAGSIRDDGPLPDTLMDLVEAQDRYAVCLKDAALVLMLASMLHGIGVGNMLPSAVRVVCIDINPAVVTKLGDRGSSQTVGIVTDTGLFLHQLAETLRSN